MAPAQPITENTSGATRITVARCVLPALRALGSIAQVVTRTRVARASSAGRGCALLSATQPRNQTDSAGSPDAADVCSFGIGQGLPCNRCADEPHGQDNSG